MRSDKVFNANHHLVILDQLGVSSLITYILSAATTRLPQLAMDSCFARFIGMDIHVYAVDFHLDDLTHSGASGSLSSPPSGMFIRLLCLCIIRLLCRKPAKNSTPRRVWNSEHNPFTSEESRNLGRSGHAEPMV